MPNVQDTNPVIVGNPLQYTAIINPANNANLSTSLYCGGNSFISLQLNASFTPGNIYFFNSITGVPGTYYQLTDDTGTLLTISTASVGSAISPGVGIQIPLDPTIFAGVQNLMIGCANPQMTLQQLNLVMAPVLG